jgi:hypothetical protein
MKKLVFALFVCCLVSLSTAAWGIEGLGRYDGYRETPAVRDLTALEARHFELLHAGKTAEAAALMKNQIKPLQEKVAEFACHFETKAYTYINRHQFTVHMYFAPLSEKEGKNGGVDVYLLQLAPTLEQFERVFESKETLDRFPIDGFHYDTFVTTRQEGARRTITIDQTNKVDDEITSIFKRQTCIIRLDEGLINSIEVEKQKKRFLNMGGWQKTFAAKVIGLRKVAQGLLLVDNGDMGRLQNRDNILKALADKSPKNFHELLRAEK